MQEFNKPLNHGAEDHGKEEIERKLSSCLKASTNCPHCLVF